MLKDGSETAAEFEMHSPIRLSCSLYIYTYIHRPQIEIGSLYHEKISLISEIFA